MPGRLTRHLATFVPTRRLALATAAIAPLWLLSAWPWGAWVAAAAVVLLVAAALWDAIAAPAASHLDVDRQAPPAVGIGDRAEGTYVVRSRWPRPLRARLHDAPPAAVARELGAPDALAIPAGGEAVVPFALVGRTRGVHELGPVVLRVAGPLGLLERTLRYRPEDRVTVTPSLAGVRRFRLLALQHRLRDAGVRAVRRRGEGTSFANLREYARGDDPRHIDWKATARRGKLIAREFSVEQGQTVMILVDAGRLMTQLAGDLPRFEYALSSALVLAEVAAHSGDQVGLMVFDDEVRAFLPPARGRAAFRRLRDALIPVTASMAEPDYAAAFRTLAARHRKRSRVIVFSDVIDARASHALIAHTMRGAVRHLPLVVALRNDALVAAALPANALPEGRAQSTGLYEAAAAEELLSAREEALARMRRAGVAVVDVSPHAMTAAVVNRYLELKAREAV